MVRNFLLVSIGYVCLAYVVWFLQSLYVVFFVAHYGATVPYKGTRGVILDVVDAIVVMTIVISKLCLFRPGVVI